MNIEEIKDRVNLTKNAFHKLGIEGQVNINVMLNDIEFLLKEIEELKEENKILEAISLSFKEIQDKDKKWEDKIKAKIEEIEKLKTDDENSIINKIVNWFINQMQSLLEKE